MRVKVRDEVRVLVEVKLADLVADCDIDSVLVLLVVRVDGVADTDGVDRGLAVSVTVHVLEMVIVGTNDVVTEADVVAVSVADFVPSAVTDALTDAV